jgi:Zn-dependent membrane protease YugP
MIHFDPLYLIIMLGTTALAMWASWRVKAAYNRYSQVPATSGLSGAQIAQRILDLNNIHDVEVVPTHGLLSDHYDPQNKKLVLCEENFYGTNVAALGVAAHEAGHAIQHKQLYAPLQWRMAAVGITTMAGQAIPFIGFGLFYLAPKIAIPALAICFGIVMVFQLITLPVEFDATARAKRILAHTGAVAPGQETESMGKVLDAAALTYVAAFIGSLATFLYYILQMMGGRRDEE